MIHKRFLLSGLVLALALTVAAIAAPALGAQTPTAGGTQLPRTITVVGQGSVTAAPERARLSVGVESIATSAQTASKDNTTKMDAVLAALKKAGITDKDMQTNNYSIWTESMPGEGSDAQPKVRYHVTNQVTVVVNDPAKVSDLLDAVIAAGATSIYGVNFEVKDTGALEGKARAAAIQDAQARAADLARLTGVKVGPVVQVSEVIGNALPYREAAQGMGGGGGPQINPGELTFNSQVQVTYELLR
ncbi:MAG: SIMPL domain-containing protein [Ardenticatenaceae bacterium]|nr:SIMPL domain-containing protein [Ardenticatenaceae bacterium]HBY94043.1 hypothetical protein [Chloroflexota bacterium]